MSIELLYEPDIHLSLFGIFYIIFLFMTIDYVINSHLNKTDILWLPIFCGLLGVIMMQPVLWGMFYIVLNN